ncbi:MAG: CHAT domain-containing protein, partial [Symploca sp. SIO2C1]|nr:CHAT domain-containing protein [Symploca sp. SIO2C1]
NNLGLAYKSLAEYEQAIHFHEQSLAISREIGDRQGEANSLVGLRNAYHRLAESEQAFDFHEQSLAIFSETSERQEEANSLDNQGNASRGFAEYEGGIFSGILTRHVEANSLYNQGNDYYNLAEYEQAIDFFEQSLAVFKEIGDRQGEANSLNGLGAAYDGLEEYEQAIDLYEESLTIFKEIGNLHGEAISLYNLGNAYSSLEEYEQAIDLYEESLAIAREIGYRQQEADSLNNLGNVYYDLEEYDQAIDLHEESLAIAREIGYRQGVANSLQNLGNAYSDKEDYTKAKDYYQQSLIAFEELDNSNKKSSIAWVIHKLGETYNYLGDYEQGINYLQQSLEVFQELNDFNGEAWSFHELGIAYTFLTDYDQAINYNQQSLAIFEKNNDLNGRAWSLHSLGIAHMWLGDYDKAIDHSQESLAVFQEIKDRSGQAQALCLLGLINFYKGNWLKSINYYQEIFSSGDEQGYLREDIDNEYLEYLEYMKKLTVFYQNLSQLLEEADSSEQISDDEMRKLWESYIAEEPVESLTNFYESMLLLARNLDNPWGEAFLLDLTGYYLYNSQEEYDKAREAHQQSLEIYERIGDLRGQGEARKNLGLALFNSGEYAQAEAVLREGIEILEEVRKKLPDDDQKVAIFETQKEAYRVLQQTLVSQNKSEEALEVSERGRARAIVEILAESPEIESPDLREIQRIAKEENATLVEYSVISDSIEFGDWEHSTVESLYIWVVKPDGTVYFRTVDLPQDGLGELVKDSRESIGVTGRGINGQQGNFDNKLRELHQLLIEPIADILPKNEEERVIFIPHQELFLVPFPALQDTNDKYLIEKHTILTAPSIQTLSLVGQRQISTSELRGTEALVVGDPVTPKLGVGQDLQPLPGAKREAEQVTTTLKEQLTQEVKTLIGSQATETAIVKNMRNANIIHLAAHGLLDDISGVGSPGAIALAPSGKDDGFLTTTEIMEQFVTSGTPLKAELVVLSACDTGRGEIKGEGVIGLSRSIIAAGAQSLVVSLWKVPDEATAELMAEFYTNLYEEKLDKAQALRQAMLTMLNEGENPDPQDWAAFTVIGEAE